MYLKKLLLELGGNTLTNAIKPDHYNSTTMSTIEVIEELCAISNNDNFTDYNRFQAFKYIWRAGNKDPVLQDLKKARTFLNFAIDYLESKDNV